MKLPFPTPKTDMEAATNGVALLNAVLPPSWLRTVRKRGPFTADEMSSLSFCVLGRLDAWENRALQDTRSEVGRLYQQCPLATFGFNPLGDKFEDIAAAWNTLLGLTK